MYKVNEKNIIRAVQALQNGELIIYPTDTLYSFGADSSNDSALKKLNKVKNRTSPYSIFLSEIDDIKKFAFVEDDVFKKIKIILPGPYTILLQSKDNPIISKFVQQGSDLIGIRMINNFFCNGIISYLKNPIVTTSVNIHSKLPLTDINKIEEKYSDLNIFFSQKKLNSKGSTILDFSQNQIKVVRLGEGKVDEIFN